MELLGVARRLAADAYEISRALPLRPVCLTYYGVWEPVAIPASRARPRVGREREFIVYRLCANRARRGTLAAPLRRLLYPYAEAIRDEALRLALARGLPVVLDLSAAPFLDANGAEAVRDVTAACGAAGLRVFAEVVTGVLDRLNADGVHVSGLAFPTVDEACASIAKAEPGAAARPLTGTA